MCNTNHAKCTDAETILNSSSDLPKAETSICASAILFQHNCIFHTWEE